MNKKFFTLIAGILMLAGTVGGANAQITIGHGTAPEKLKEGAKYQLAITTKAGLEIGLQGGYDTNVGAAVGSEPAGSTVSTYGQWVTTNWATAGITEQAAATALLPLLAGSNIPGTSSFLWYAWINADGDLKGASYDSFGATIGESIFCVNIVENAIVGKNATLDIQNWVNGRQLLIDEQENYDPANPPATINVKQGDLGEWGYSSTYASDIQHWRPLYTYVPGKKDSVYLYVYNINLQDKVELIQFPANRIHTAALPDSALLFEFVEPAPVVLTEDDWNSKFGSVRPAAAQKLKFNTDYPATANIFAPTTGSPWSENALTAINVTASKPTTLTNNWLYFKKANNEFLYVDTAYYGDATNTLKFNYGDTLASRVVNGNTITGGYGGTTYNDVVRGGVGDGNSDFINQYRFQVRYFWTNDSIAIDVAQATFKPFQNTGLWSEYVPTPWGAPHYEIGATYATSTLADAGYLADVTAGTINSSTTGGDSLHVKLVDLVRGTRVLTVGDRTLNTSIIFDIRSCVEPQDNTDTMDEGLYIIVLNNAGWPTDPENGKLTSGVRYLGVDINTDSLEVGTSLNSPKWTQFFDVQDPREMPAYQWVVIKERPTRKDSPITVINREYPNIRYTHVQLLKGTANSTGALQVNKSWFKKVPAKYANDEYLGYYNITENESALYTYSMEYLRGYQSDGYLGIGSRSSEKGNELAIVPTPVQFQIVPLRAGFTNTPAETYAVPYGYRITNIADADELEARYKELGFVPLKRTAYQIRTEDANLTVNTSVNNQPFYVTTTATNVVTGRFFIKTWNTLGVGADKKNYYALLDLSTAAGSNITATPLDYTGTNLAPRYIPMVKLGIVDGSEVAYAQVQREQRNSTFHIGKYKTPLYRRFDGGEYTYNNPDDPNAKTDEAFAGDSAKANIPGNVDPNSPLFLKFFRLPQNWIYLYENSDKDNKFRSGLNNAAISFLGLQDIVHFPEGNKDDKDPRGVASYYEFYVDTAFVARDEEGLKPSNTADYTAKPQYMLALHPEIMKGGKRRICVTNGFDVWEGEGTPPDPSDPSWGQWTCTDIDVPALTRGMYLYNAYDSVAAGLTDFAGKVADNIENDVRFAFIDGVHMGDTFYVLPATITIEGKSTATKGLDTRIIQRYAEEVLYNLPVYYKHYLGENTHFQPRYRRLSTTPPASTAITAANNVIASLKNRYGDPTRYAYATDDIYTSGTRIANGKSMVFQFRLKNIVKQANKDRDFYIETTTWDGIQIGPQFAQFINDHNGAPIVSEAITFTNAQWNDGAMAFQVEQAKGDDYGKATSTEAVAAGVQIISGEGAVTILNAAGKTVTVTNVLGQTIAKTVVTSDNATIALPKGIVVVSVDGESSKAVVK